MSASTPRGREAAVSAALAASVRRIEEQGPGRWTFALGGRRGRPGSARLAPPWLYLEIVPARRDADPETLFHTLERGALFRGGARIVIAEDGGIALRAEIAVEPDVPIEDRIRRACRGLREASIFLRGRAPSSRPDPGGSGSAPRGDPIASVAAVCSETGWPCRRRSGGDLAVDLDVPGVFLQAIVQARPGGGAIASVALAPAEAVASPIRRAATAVLLAASAGQIPLARPAVAETAGFAVAFDADPKPSEVAHALASLSIACGICGREASLFVDEALAARYLRIRGWSSDALRAAG